MRILVVGAGATGGYFGGLLARAGRDVTFMVRSGRAQALRDNGLTVISANGEWSIKPAVVTPDELDAPYDVVLLSVKAYSLDDAVRDFAPAVGSGTVIVPGLNGMAHMNLLDERFDREHVLGGVMFVATTLDDEGRIVQLNDRLDSLIWGARDASVASRAAALEDGFNGAGFTARRSDHIELEMWEKWVNLASLGAVNCLMRGTVGEIASAHGGIAFAEGIAGETIAAAAANGFEIRPAATERIYGMLTDPESTLTSSMYRDLVGRRPTEADHIVGDLIARARVHSVDVPLLELAYTHLSVYQRRFATG
jgi:2-dehydropantoate 2-reductase